MSENKENQIDDKKKRDKDSLAEQLVAVTSEVADLKELRRIEKSIKKAVKDKEEILKEVEAEKAMEVRTEAEEQTRLDAGAKVLGLLESLDKGRVDSEVAVSQMDLLSKKDIKAKKKAFHSIGNSIELRVIYGYHNKYEDEVPAVIVNSKIIEGKQYTFFLEELNSKNKIIVEQIKSKISRIGNVNESMWKQLVDKANSLFTIERIFEQVEVITGVITSKGDSMAKANYDKVFSFCIENEARFASLSANNYDPEYHYGVKLDNKKWQKKYGKVLWAITSDTLSKHIFPRTKDVYDGKRSNKELHDFKQTLREYVDWSDNREHTGLILTSMKAKYESKEESEDDVVNDNNDSTAKEKKRLWCFRFSMNGKLGRVK